ncbi:MAG: 5'-nucleotidase C-terminal domain-containing protein [Oscillospiraceae bacterium]|nr:5'-nucleotidase C-terminal domain-containing protein [Oscillospiraceae bacterium]
MKKHSSPSRAAALLLTLALALSLFSACGSTKRDDGALSVFIPMAGDHFNNLEALLQEAYPDIVFEKSGYFGSASSTYLLQRFEVGDLTDIIITTTTPSEELQKETMLDLSGYDFVQNYKASALNKLDVEGRIYFLEGPTTVRGIAYNKTLFEEMGWEAPSNHEEFTALIAQIKQESDIMPLAIPGKYPGTYFTLMSELSFCDFLQTPDGSDWQRRFAAGEASSREGFQTGISLLQDWVDAGAFDESQNISGSTDDRIKLLGRECAMLYFLGNQSALVEEAEAAEDEFGTFPLYGLGEESDFCATGHGIKIGLNKRLGEPGNEAKLENALKLLELFSTTEGQMIYYSGESDILPLVGSGSELPELFDGLKSTIDSGHTSPYLYAGYADIMTPTGEYLQKQCSSGGELSGVFELMDELRKTSLETGVVSLATVEETLDESQTAQFVANALNAQGLGDFALVSRGEYSDYIQAGGGSNGKMYAGVLDSERAIVPLSGYNMQNIVTLSLSGAQVRELLELGRIIKDEEGNSVSFKYFASGLEVTRAEDGSLESALLGGEPLDETAVYTVVFTPEDYSEETAALAEPQDTGVVWREAYRSYVLGLGTITPEDAM